MEPEGAPIESLSAVTLATGDMEAGVRFYRALGFALLYGGPTAPFTSFSAGASFLNLQLQEGRSEPEIWGRPIFWVRDVDEVYQRAVEAGYRPETEPRDAEWGERYFHILDPAGHEVSFARPLER